VSLITGIICWCIAIYVYRKSPHLRDNPLFLLIFSSMQFADVILHLNPGKTNANWIATSILVPLILSMQLFYSAYLNNKNNGNPYLFIIAIPSIFYLFWRFNGYSKPSCNQWNSPVWGGKEITLLEFLLFSIVVLYPNWKFILFTWAYMAIVVLFIKGGYGSLWCAIACLISVYLLAQSFNIIK
jgi:hypothetical protein